MRTKDIQAINEEAVAAGIPEMVSDVSGMPKDHLSEVVSRGGKRAARKEAWRKQMRRDVGLSRSVESWIKKAKLNLAQADKLLDRNFAASLKELKAAREAIDYAISAME